jgi:lipoprotein-releasing system ATP-binding protein
MSKSSLRTQPRRSESKAGETMTLAPTSQPRSNGELSPMKIDSPNAVSIHKAHGKAGGGIASDSIIMSATNLTKTYRTGKVEVPVLKGVDFVAERNRLTAIIGQSGSGKSTLLHLLGTLDQPDGGEVYFDGRRIDNLSRRQRDQFRNQTLGMIFQFYHLLPELTTLENVMVPSLIGHGMFKYFAVRNKLRARAAELLDWVGLGHRLKHRPNELSGGEMQRTAIARALMAEPRILLADEPTGNLDPETGHGILDLLKKLNQQQQMTIIMVTHDEAIARSADCCIRLLSGRVQQVHQHAA